MSRLQVITTPQYLHSSTEFAFARKSRSIQCAAFISVRLVNRGTYSIHNTRCAHLTLMRLSWYCSSTADAAARKPTYEEAYIRLQNITCLFLSTTEIAIHACSLHVLQFLFRFFPLPAAGVGDRPSDSLLSVDADAACGGEVTSSLFCLANQRVILVFPSTG